MRWGTLKLFCAICGGEIIYNGNKPTCTFRHQTFGIICSEGCFRKAENKYARMVLGKDDE